MSLRLEKLPDRKPVKMTLTLDPELHDSLTDYAAIYQRTYGTNERPEALAPAILDAFLKGDSAFKRARKTLKQPDKEI